MYSLILSAENKQQQQKQLFITKSLITFISAFFRVKMVSQDLKVTWALKVIG